MSGPLVVVRARDADALVALARHARALGFRSADAHAPHRIEALDEALGLPPSPVRPAMLIAAAASAGGIFVLQWFNATQGYPINSGGRPLDSWPAFLFTVFEMGVLGAAVAGFVTMLWACGLPRPHHRLFDARGVEAITDGRLLPHARRARPASGARRPSTRYAGGPRWSSLQVLE